MDINKWKSVAIDVDTYAIVKAMGKQGFRGPGAMIAKLVDSEAKKLAKKNGVSPESFKAKLLAEGKSLTKSKK
tara:strand:+ start:628 stop:846 length:219 start_codon:yes stop_codon:yes gene_type:complete